MQVLLIIFAGVLVAISAAAVRDLPHPTSFAVSQKNGHSVWSCSLIVLLFGGDRLHARRAAHRRARAGALPDAMPKAYEQAKGWAGKISAWAGRDQYASPASLGQPGGHSNLMGNITGAFSMTLSAALTLLLILFLGLYLAAEPQLYIDGFHSSLRARIPRPCLRKSWGPSARRWPAGWSGKAWTWRLSG